VSEVREYRQSRFVRPPGACELLLVRHGESAPARDDQPFPLVDGHGDPELAPAGREQAFRVAERLEHEDIAAIYVSTLRRTSQTAAPLATRLGIELRVEPDLREVGLGEWEGGSFRRHIAEGHPIAKRMLEEQRWDVIPGAEPADVFAARVREAVRRIATGYPDQTVVVVSHGGVIGQILAEAAGTGAFTFAGSDNAAISHLVVSGDQWTIRRYNDTAHLGLAFTTMPEPPS
jgi:2,3-bisphosphoglycerate-dependent phosphoglycerate mutase